jgi:hypothetical protein
LEGVVAEDIRDCAIEITLLALNEVVPERRVDPLLAFG